MRAPLILAFALLCGDARGAPADKPDGLKAEPQPAVAAPEERCQMFPASVRCPGDPLGVKVCDGGPLLVLADGRTQPLPDGYFDRGWQVYAKASDLPRCKDGSVPITNGRSPYLMRR